MLRIMIVVLLSIGALAAEEGVGAEEYGVDSSFPMHYNKINEDESNPLGMDNRLSAYRTFLSGCNDYYSAHYDHDTAQRCTWNEEERIHMNLNQPKDMHNYTSAGFAKVAAPEKVTALLKEFWTTQHKKDDQLVESWPKGNTYVNHWDASTSIMTISADLEHAIASLVRPVLESWTGQPLVVTSVYGVRVYKEGAILAPHVDRLPLVTSCILNVAQDVDEDWPLELIGHDGTATNVTAHPGDMILYESHSVIHGRPFALKGRYYANIFVHFEPHGYTKNFMDKGSEWIDSNNDEKDLNESEEELYHLAEQQLEQLQKQQAEQHRTKAANGIPDYVDEKMAARWKQDYIYSEDKKLPPSANIDLEAGAIIAKQMELLSPHTAAALGKLTLLKEMEKKDPKALTSMDGNGWRPIHEAARSGSKDVLVYLLETVGADVNERTNDGRGATALFWAEQMLDKDHEAIQYLKAKGAKNLAPRSRKSAEL